MGLLDFLGGAASAVPSVVDSMEWRDELQRRREYQAEREQRVRDQHLADIDAQRKYEAEKEQRARDGKVAGANSMAAAILGLTPEEAAALAARQNPYTTKQPQTIDDGGRQRTVGVTAPDDARFQATLARYNKIVGYALAGNAAKEVQGAIQADDLEAKIAEAGGDQKKLDALAREKQVRSGVTSDQTEAKTGLLNAQIARAEAAAALANAKAANPTTGRPDPTALKEGELLRSYQSDVDTARRNLADAQRTLKDAAGKSKREAAQAEVAAAQSEFSRAQSALDAVRRRMSGEAPAEQKKRSFDPARVREEARRVIAANPGKRDEVLRRMRENGIDTTGL